METTIHPYEEGWDVLSIDQRIQNWLEVNASGVQHRTEDFKNFLSNFSASHRTLDEMSLTQLEYELRKQEYEYWTEEEKQLLTDGVFSMYNTTPGLLELKMFNDQQEQYKNN